MSCQRKSNERSATLRAEANRLYVQKRFFNALIKYNESLCFAEAKSENLGLAYANRSAVYLEIGQFDKCLENIELARDNFYPSSKFELLAKRAEKCKHQMRNNNDSDSESNRVGTFLKLSYESHEKLPYLAKCLELRRNEKYGRHIITTRQLNAGDVVAFDVAEFKVIKSDSRYDTCDDTNVFQRCSDCLDDNRLSLIPCSECCKTMYCSIDCMKSAYIRYHRFECEIIDELLTSGIEHISLRMLFEGLSLFGDDICAMEKYLKKSSIGNGNNDDGGRVATLTIFDLVNNIDEDESAKKKILTAISLASSDFELQFRLSNHYNDDYEKKISKVFRASPKLTSLWTKMNKSNEIFVKDLMSRLQRVAVNYMHGIGGWSLKKAEVDEGDDNNMKTSTSSAPQLPSAYQHLIGNGCYLFCSLLNHSCAPNVQRLNVANDKIAVIVSRPIRKGEQLFDSYRQQFNVQPKTLRRETLLRDYDFECDCEACINDYPTNKNLPIHNEELLEMAWEMHENLPFFTPQVATEQVKKFHKIINDQHRRGNFPSAELVVLQQCISNCLIAITKPSIQFP